MLALTAELVPATSWYSNLRNTMGREDWDRLRREVDARHRNLCGVCESAGTLHCHEIWRYDDIRRVQTLDGFIALCPWCHHIKHLGLANILAERGERNYERLIRHFLWVNACNRQAFHRHRDEAFAQWEKRSKHNWTVDLGKYAMLVRKRGC